MGTVPRLGTTYLVKSHRYRSAVRGRSRRTLRDPLLSVGLEGDPFKVGVAPLPPKQVGLSDAQPHVRVPLEVRMCSARDGGPQRDPDRTPGSGRKEACGQTRTAACAGASGAPTGAPALARLERMRADELADSGLRDPQVASDFDEADAPLSHESPREPRRGAKPLGHLLHGQEVVVVRHRSSHLQLVASPTPRRPSPKLGNRLDHSNTVPSGYTSSYLGDLVPRTQFDLQLRKREAQ